MFGKIWKHLSKKLCFWVFGYRYFWFQETKAIYQTLSMGSFLEEKVPFHFILIKNEWWSGSFCLTIIWNKRNKFDRRTDAHVGSFHLPTNHRLRNFEVSHVSEPKRETHSDVCCTSLKCSFCFNTIKNEQLFSFV